MRLPLVLLACTVGAALAQAAPEVTFYPTFGYPSSARPGWVIPLRARVLSPHTKTQFIFRQFGHRYAEKHHFPDALTIFDARVQEIITSAEEIDGLRVAFAEKAPSYPVVNGEVFIPGSDAAALFPQDSAKDVWLSFHAVGRPGTGRVRMLSAAGHSVISDIDDTIKITEIPAGQEVVIRNTFFRPYVAAPTMQARYQAWAEKGAAFHYLSAGPWQLYTSLERFRQKEGFPEGSFQMRTIPTFSFGNLSAMHEMLTDREAAYTFKVQAIRELIGPFKGKARQFTLVGDSGERDPEVYATIKAEFPENVDKIVIREVVHPLEGVEVIQAIPVRKGHSQFDAPE